MVLPNYDPSTKINTINIWISNFSIYVHEYFNLHTRIIKFIISVFLIQIIQHFQNPIHFVYVLYVFINFFIGEINIKASWLPQKFVINGQEKLCSCLVIENTVFFSFSFNLSKILILSIVCNHISEFIIMHILFFRVLLYRNKSEYNGCFLHIFILELNTFIKFIF